MILDDLSVKNAGILHPRDWKLNEVPYYIACVHFIVRKTFLVYARAVYFIFHVKHIKSLRREECKCKTRNAKFASSLLFLQCIYFGRNRLFITNTSNTFLSCKASDEFGSCYRDDHHPSCKHLYFMHGNPSTRGRVLHQLRYRKGREICYLGITRTGTE